LGELKDFRQHLYEGLELLVETGSLCEAYHSARLAGKYLMNIQGQAEQAVEFLIFSQRHFFEKQEELEVTSRLDRLKKNLSPEVFEAAARRAGTRDPMTTAAMLLEYFSPRDDAESPSESPEQALDDLGDLLTQRETEVLHLLADGLNSREVSEHLVLSVGTVRWYMKQIYSKLDVHSRSEAIARARTLQLIE